MMQTTQSANKVILIPKCSSGLNKQAGGILTSAKTVYLPIMMYLVWKT